MKLLNALATLVVAPVMLPILGALWVANKAVVPFRKSSSNGMIYLETPQGRELFSPFFEFEAPFLDTQLLVKVVIKLGNDGIDKTVHAPLTIRAQMARKNSLLFREATLFLIHQGEQAVEITPRYLEIDGESISTLDAQPVIIAGGHYHECAPIMVKEARDVSSFEIKVVLEWQNELYIVAGTAARLTVKALRDKYHPKEPHET